jgi:hypothetical protein
MRVSLPMHWVVSLTGRVENSGREAWNTRGLVPLMHGGPAHVCLTPGLAGYNQRWLIFTKITSNTNHGPYPAARNTAWALWFEVVRPYADQIVWLLQNSDIQEPTCLDAFSLHT